MTSAQIAILTTLIAYKVVLVLIGMWAERRNRSGTDFFLGGRGLGPWVAALSASASSSSVWTLLGVSGAAYEFGLSALWLFPACVGGFVLNWYVVAPALRRFSHANDSVTLVDVLTTGATGAVGQAIRWIASLVILVSLVAYVASQFQGAGKSLEENFDVSLTSSVLIGASVVLFYTLLGGFWAVSLTDSVQATMMLIACVLLPLAALVEVGGPVGLVEGLREVDVPGFWSLTRGATGIAAIGFALGFLGIGLGYPGQPHVVSRFMAMRQGDSDDPGREIRIARRVAIGWAVLVYAGMLVLGLSGRLILESQSADTEAIFFRLTQDLFHPVVGGILLAAVLSAIMSTADSQLLVAASTIAHDAGLGGSDAKTQMRRSRVVVLLVGATAVAVALFGSKKIFDSVLFGWTAMGAAFGPALILKIFGWRVPATAILASLLVGAGLAIGFHGHESGSTGKPLARFLPYVASAAVVIVPALIARARSRTPPRP